MEFIGQSQNTKDIFLALSGMMSHTHLLESMFNYSQSMHTSPC